MGSLRNCHICPVGDCGELVPDHFELCQRHFHSLPVKSQRRIRYVRGLMTQGLGETSMRDGPTRTRRVSSMYLRLIKDGCRWLYKNPDLWLGVDKPCGDRR